MLTRLITFSYHMPTLISTIRINSPIRHSFLYLDTADIEINDSLPGSDRIAKKTGAIVIANGEAINLLRVAGVPDAQLMPVAGGERIPLFRRTDREKASAGAIDVARGPPGAPPRPDDRFAAMAVHVWPSLHCFMPGPPGQHPDVIDTRTRYTGGAGPYSCTLDITFGMKYALLRLDEIVPKEMRDAGIQSMIDYTSDRKRHVFSEFDGGQLSYNFLIGESKTLFWNGHLGGYEGVLKAIEPKPDVAVLAVAGRANLDGRPYDGSAAEFIKTQLDWIGQPETVIWSLYDQS